MKTLYILIATSFITITVNSQTLPSTIEMKNIDGGTFTMGDNNLTGSPDQQAAAPEHQVTLSDFSLSEAEITNAQYLEFLTSAYQDGLIEVVTGTTGPDMGLQLIQGTATSSYDGKVLYNLDGTRVMKDHDNSDNDNDPFTGVIEPENPLNISYIGFNSTTGNFYLKDPHDVNDFHWMDICDYYDWGTTKGSKDTILKNDFDDWAGSGQNHSDELQGWTPTNPTAATNLPNKSDIMEWPVTFVRWWGAKAFAEYYGNSLPTEAQWEYAAKGGQGFKYGVYDGVDLSDANWNDQQLPVALHHVRKAISGTANPFGIYNLAGNAWEWIEDNYVAPYSTTTVTDPLIIDAGSTVRCWRGGSWNYHEATLQSGMRYYDEEDRGNDHFGFRIAGEYDSGSSSIQENFEKSENYFYPNPTNDFIIIHSTKENVQVELYSATGELLISCNESNQSKIDIDFLENGIYLIKIGKQIQKLIKTN